MIRLHIRIKKINIFIELRNTHRQKGRLERRRASLTRHRGCSSASLIYCALYVFQGVYAAFCLWQHRAASLLCESLRSDQRVSGQGVRCLHLSVHLEKWYIKSVIVGPEKLLHSHLLMDLENGT